LPTKIMTRKGHFFINLSLRIWQNNGIV